MEEQLSMKLLLISFCLALVATAAAQTAPTPAEERGQRIFFPPAPDAVQPAAAAQPTPAAPSPQATLSLPPVVDAAPSHSPPALPALPTTAAPQPPNVQSPKIAGKAALGSGDLWDRIRKGFAMPDLQTDLVNNREQWYSSKPDYIARMTERSSKYLYHIVEELETRKMPTELALLPFIESAFNPQAVSTAKAAGMWQFIPSTGKFYDLKQNAFRDDRRDVQASTRAALDYLQKLHGMFGDWHLALAAYNWGEGSVGRAIAKNKKLGKETNYLDLAMPNETRYYVPKLQAVKNIVANPSGYNSTLPVIDNHPYFVAVPIQRDMDVVLAAKFADVPVADFKALNPSLSRPVILAAGTPNILMPWSNAELFNTNVANFAGQLASWTVWTSPVALKPIDAARRVGMSESQLREVNNIPAKAGVIKAGSTLLVPRLASKTEDVSAHVADHGQVNTNSPVAKGKARKGAVKKSTKRSTPAKKKKR
jgi:membrane-bound lytic murein transglycosylase D